MRAVFSEASEATIAIKENTMKVKAIYQGNNEAILAARYGQGEVHIKTTFTLTVEAVPEVIADTAKGIAAVAAVKAIKGNEPKVGSEIIVDLKDEAKNEETLAQESHYNNGKDNDGQTIHAC